MVEATLRRAHRWRLWLFLLAMLPPIALLLYAPQPGPWLAAAIGVALSLRTSDSDTPRLNRWLIVIAAVWPVAALIRTACC